MNIILDIRKLSKSYDGLLAVDTLDLSVREREIMAIIGPNGAGKTTMFNLITGADYPSDGAIMFRGRNIAGYKPHTTAAMGIARTFQNTRLFGGLTVRENVLIGKHCTTKQGILGALFRTASVKQEELRTNVDVIELLELVGLSGKADEQSTSLPYGEQRRLEIARALALHPRLLLLDEPSAGMNAQEIAELMRLIEVLRDRGLTVVLIEHHMQMLNIADRVVVLDYGRKIAEGTPENVRREPKVIEAYIGGEAD